MITNFIGNMTINCVVSGLISECDIWLSVHYKDEINEKPEASNKKKAQKTEKRKTKKQLAVKSRSQCEPIDKYFEKKVKYQLSASYPQHLERFEAKSANLIMNDSDPDTKEEVTE